MKLLVLDKNTDYAQRLKFYMGKKFPQLQVSVCDGIEGLKSLIEKEVFDVVLFDSSFDDVKTEDLGSSFERAAFAYISDTDEIINETASFMKYQRVSVMYDKICELYEQKRNRVVKRGEDTEGDGKKSEIITFFPVNGGAGSSTVAAACAISLAADSKVLYLNLEQRPSDKVFFNGEGKKSLSNIVEFLKTKYTDQSLHKTIREAIRVDRSYGGVEVSFIRGYANIMDGMSMTENLTDVLLKIIKEKLDFRYIIVDTDFIMGRTLKKTIDNSDKMVFVSSGSDIANIKLAEIQRYLDVLKRDADNNIPESFHFFNQYYGLKEELTIARDMPVIARTARYRNNDNSRIESRAVIREINSGKNAFAMLKTVAAKEEKNQ